MRRHSRKRGNLRPFYVWHRRIGLLAGFFVLILCLTGLALNHTEALRLDERHVSADWLLDWYGVPPPEVTSHFTAGDIHVTLVEDKLYVANTPLAGRFEQLSGAVAVGEVIAIVADGDVLILTSAGDFIERLGRVNGLPSGIRKVGAGPKQELVVSANGGNYRSQEQFVEWQQTDSALDEISWSAPSQISAEQAEQLQRDYQSQILPLERVLLDLH
ncbi:MAG: hypothetical protein ACR2QU_02495, partial [Gammaproteobacteria bacterium]